MSKKGGDDEMSKKLDLCLTDGIIKTGAGIILGGLASLMFFRRRKWPMITGMGMGLGLAYANCEYALNTKGSKA